MVELDFDTAMNEDFVNLMREREKEVKDILAKTELVHIGVNCVLNRVEINAMEGRGTTQYDDEQLVRAMHSMRSTELKELNIKGYREAYRVNSKTSFLGEVTVYRSLALNTLMQLIRVELQERGFSVGMHYYNGDESYSGRHDVESIEVNLKLKAPYI